MKTELPSFQAKLDSQPPQRKLLALDGGGIRGMISIEVLAEMERILRDRTGQPDLVLAEYFDYIGGTSTGAIIATFLSWGMSTEEVRTFYEENGAAMFAKAPFFRKLRYKFQATALSRQLQDIFGSETTFGSDKLHTLLMIVLRNATTDSAWPLSNNPSAKYNDPADPGCNLQLPLWRVVRASTAAPTFFPPEEATIGGNRYLFVDGGVTMFNNPAWQLFLMATADPYRLGWPTGAEKLLLVSVGTGMYEAANKNLRAKDMNLLYNASSIPGALMTAASQQQDLCCRMFGRCVAGRAVDGEVGDLIGAGIADVPKAFTYARYNVDMAQDSLDALGLPHTKTEHVLQMDNVKRIPQFQELGRAVAAATVRAEHFEGF